MTYRTSYAEAPTENSVCDESSKIKLHTHSQWLGSTKRKRKSFARWVRCATFIVWVRKIGNSFNAIKGLGVCYTVWLGSMTGLGLRTRARRGSGPMLWPGWLSSLSTATPPKKHNITNIRHTKLKTS